MNSKPLTVLMHANCTPPIIRCREIGVLEQVVMLMPLHQIAGRIEAVGIVGRQRRHGFPFQQPHAAPAIGVEALSEASYLMEQAAQKHPRWGVRKVYQTLRRKQALNHKRVHRLWKQAGLQVRARRRRKYKPPATQAQAVVALRPGQVWSLDFVFDATQAGGKLKMLTVGDDFTRQCLTIAVGTTFSAYRLQQELARLVQVYGLPAAIRMDNGPERTAQEVQVWLSEQGILAAYIQKGSPWQNGFRESFHSRLRDELLSFSVFVNVADAKQQAEAFRQAYNQERPHQALGGRTPDEYHQAWLQQQSTANGD